MDTLFIAVAGLMGASGVVLAAASAHGGTAGSGLDSAAYLLLLHASAVIALSAARRVGLTSRRLTVLATWGFVIGAGLFATDIALRGFAGHRLFPFAAPTGGSILIASWIIAALAGLMTRRGA